MYAKLIPTVNDTDPREGVISTAEVVAVLNRSAQPVGPVMPVGPVVPVLPVVPVVPVVPVQPVGPV